MCTVVRHSHEGPRSASGKVTRTLWLSALLKGNANKLFKHSSQWCGRTLCENMDTVSWRTCLSPGRRTHYQASTYGRHGVSYYWFQISSPTWNRYGGLFIEADFPSKNWRWGCFTKMATKHWIWSKFYKHFYEKIADESWKWIDVKTKDSRLFAFWRMKYRITSRRKRVNDLHKSIFHCNETKLSRCVCHKSTQMEG
jgi:hypothetical protein